MRLIRSKGVGVYFVTQNPLDIPDTVAAQLGNRVQHALRAFTPRDQRAVKAAAETFRQNPAIKTAEAITQLAVGEALVSTLEGKGTPSMVERTLIRPPSAQVGPITPQERARIMALSPLSSKYDTVIDRESAFEILQKRAQEAAEAEASANSGIGGMLGGLFGGGSPAPTGTRKPAGRQPEIRFRTDHQLGDTVDHLLGRAADRQCHRARRARQSAWQSAIGGTDGRARLNLARPACSLARQRRPIRSWRRSIRSVFSAARASVCRRAMRRRPGAWGADRRARAYPRLWWSQRRIDGAVADATLAAGGDVIGVLPKALEEKELAHRRLTRLHVVSSMHERKARMAELSDAFIALPGGLARLRRSSRSGPGANSAFIASPAGLLDVDGYYGALRGFIDHAVGQGFMRPQHRDMFALRNERRRAARCLPAL